MLFFLSINNFFWRVSSISIVSYLRFFFSIYQQAFGFWGKFSKLVGKILNRVFGPGGPRHGRFRRPLGSLKSPAKKVSAEVIPCRNLYQSSCWMQGNRYRNSEPPLSGTGMLSYPSDGAGNGHPGSNARTGQRGCRQPL